MYDSRLLQIYFRCWKFFNFKGFYKPHRKPPSNPLYTSDDSLTFLTAKNSTKELYCAKLKQGGFYPLSKPTFVKTLEILAIIFLH